MVAFILDAFPDPKPEAVSGFAKSKPGRLYTLVTFSAWGPFGP